MFVYLRIWNNAVNGIVITLRKERGSNPSWSKVIFSFRRVQTGIRIHQAFCIGHQGALSPE